MNTPRTAAKERESERCEPKLHAHYGWKHARTLERELSAKTAECQRLREALKGTLYLFEAHAVSKTDLEQIRFSRAALKVTHD